MAKIGVFSIAEQQIECETGGVRCFKLNATIRDGDVERMPELTAGIVNDDIDGCIEFLGAIKKAKEETA